MNLNKVTLVGRVTSDPKVNTTTSGVKYAKFSLATNETYKDRQGQKQETTEFHNIVFWGKVAEIVEKYVKKGGLLLVEGKITTNKYTDKSGVQKQFTEIRGLNLQLGPRPQSKSVNADLEPPAQEVEIDIGDDDPGLPLELPA